MSVTNSGAIITNFDILQSRLRAEMAAFRGQKDITRSRPDARANVEEKPLLPSVRVL